MLSDKWVAKKMVLGCYLRLLISQQMVNHLWYVCYCMETVQYLFPNFSIKCIYCPGSSTYVKYIPTLAFLGLSDCVILH